MLSKSNIWNFEALEFYDLKLRSSGIVKAIVATKDISHYLYIATFVYRLIRFKQLY